MNRLRRHQSARDLACRIVLLVLMLTLPAVVSAGAGCGTPPSPDGPLKIIIYTDFQCGACEKLNSEVETQLRERYVATGKAQIEIRLVGAMSPDSVRAAEAALCAGDQGGFLEYGESLFQAWRDSGEDVETFSTDWLVVLADSLGLDAAAFRSCLESGDKQAVVEKNMTLAQADGVQTLPTVLVGDARVEGYRPLDVYLDAIDQALEDA